MDKFRVVGGKKYKFGYTTGTCAAGAAKATVMMLLSNQDIKWVDVILPNGDSVSLEITDIERSKGIVSCAVVKDGGDDPDVTHGLSVYCRARLTMDTGINILGGVGIGKVTSPGLKMPVGEYAINPIPREMIKEAVTSVLPKGTGVELTFSIPGGDVVAKNTYNPKLGIVGGLSILGTTGIVVPMSEEAWRDAIEQEISVLAAKGNQNACFVFGNYGESYALNQLNIPEEKIVKISNFVGFFLEKAVEYNIKNVLFIGHIGKLIKVSIGIFNTHSKVADARMEALISYLALRGAPLELIQGVYNCKTTDGALILIEKFGYNNIYKDIANHCSKRCRAYTFDKLDVASVVFGGKDTSLATSDNTKRILEALNDE